MEPSCACGPSLVTKFDASTGSIRYVSPSSHAILGYRHDDLLYKNLWSFLHPSDVRRYRRAVSDRLEELRPVTHTERQSVCRVRIHGRKRRKKAGHVWLVTESLEMDEQGFLVVIEHPVPDVTWGSVLSLMRKHPAVGLFFHYYMPTQGRSTGSSDRPTAVDKMVLMTPSWALGEAPLDTLAEHLDRHNALLGSFAHSPLGGGGWPDEPSERVERSPTGDLELDGLFRTPLLDTASMHATTSAGQMLPKLPSDEASPSPSLRLPEAVARSTSECLDGWMSTAPVHAVSVPAIKNNRRSSTGDISVSTVGEGLRLSQSRLLSRRASFMQSSMQPIAIAVDKKLLRRQNTPLTDVEVTDPGNNRWSLMRRDHAVYQRYDLLERRGQGTLGVVRRAIRRADRCVVAVKTVRTDDIEIAHVVEREFEVMKSVNHPNIVKAHELINDFDREGALHLVMEYIDGPDLEEAVERYGDLEVNPLASRKMAQLKGKRRFSDGQARHVFRQLMTALVYLNENGVTHRDLSIKNLLLTSSEVCSACLKVADFNIARKGDLDGMMTPAGNLRFTAPEIVGGWAEYGQKVDVWSAGVCLYFMLTGMLPFDGTCDIMRAITEEPIEFGGPLFQGVDAAAMQLLRGLLERNQHRRLSAKLALAATWTQGIVHCPVPRSLSPSPSRRRASRRKRMLDLLPDSHTHAHHCHHRTHSPKHCRGLALEGRVSKRARGGDVGGPDTEGGDVWGVRVMSSAYRMLSMDAVHVLLTAIWKEAKQRRQRDYNGVASSSPGDQPSSPDPLGVNKGDRPVIQQVHHHHHNHTSSSTPSGPRTCSFSSSSLVSLAAEPTQPDVNNGPTVDRYTIDNGCAVGDGWVPHVLVHREELKQQGVATGVLVRVVPLRRPRATRIVCEAGQCVGIAVTTSGGDSDGEVVTRYAPPVTTATTNTDLFMDFVLRVDPEDALYRFLNSLLLGSIVHMQGPVGTPLLKAAGSSDDNEAARDWPWQSTLIVADGNHVPLALQCAQAFFRTVPSSPGPGPSSLTHALAQDSPPPPGSPQFTAPTIPPSRTSPSTGIARQSLLHHACQEPPDFVVKTVCPPPVPVHSARRPATEEVEPAAVPISLRSSRRRRAPWAGPGLPDVCETAPYIEGEGFGSWCEYQDAEDEIAGGEGTAALSMASTLSLSSFGLDEARDERGGEEGFSPGADVPPPPRLGIVVCDDEQETIPCRSELDAMEERYRDAFFCRYWRLPPSSPTPPPTRTEMDTPPLSRPLIDEALIRLLQPSPTITKPIPFSCLIVLGSATFRESVRELMRPPPNDSVAPMTVRRSVSGPSAALKGACGYGGMVPLVRLQSDLRQRRLVGAVQPMHVVSLGCDTVGLD
ncbi:unnamed protein product [Vitrella brassicaformis CCMP3155]|uniref:Protein kinase domain-containing protein n=3 Tax=Vitrella brassicaformis TaxID=1169539 RepID=A0A0G4EBC5_VITBC|nr:unnamed protein product [Vitrella brassicaformis CCMP3155]|eukprot:CEL93255.1 unnamed protein product [Vitrella brassicaformis CCMP3155]